MKWICLFVVAGWVGSIEAAPKIEKIEVELFHQVDGKLKPLGTKEIDIQTADANPLVKVKISTVEKPGVVDDNAYVLTLKGFGKGRENEAESAMEDFKFSEQRKKYVFGQYEPFLTAYPCTEKVTFTATLATVKKPSKKISEMTFETNQLNCYAN